MTDLDYGTLAFELIQQEFDARPGVFRHGLMDFHQHRRTTSTSTTNDDGSQDEKGREEEVTSLRTYVPIYPDKDLTGNAVLASQEKR